MDGARAARAPSMQNVTLFEPEPKTKSDKVLAYRLGVEILTPVGSPPGQTYGLFQKIVVGECREKGWNIASGVR